MLAYLFLMFATFALVPMHCAAQELPNTLKPRVVFERDLDSRIPNARTLGTLSRLGTELILNDATNKRLVIVDTSSFEETKVPLEFHAFDVKTDAITDMVFLEVVTPSEQTNNRIVCFKNLEALKNQQMHWSADCVSWYQHVRWLPERKRFLIFASEPNQIVTVLDQDGNKLTEQKIKGPIYGVDESEEGFNIFHLVSDRGINQLALTELDADFKIQKTRKLPIIDRPQSLRSGAWLGVSRSYRLRGLKSGEVTRYYTTIACQPGYFDMRGKLPITDLHSRLSYANKLSAAESPQQPEIILGLGKGSNGFVLFDQQSNFFYEPMQNLNDAIFDEQRKLIATWQSSVKPGYNTVRLISFE